MSPPSLHLSLFLYLPSLQTPPPLLKPTTYRSTPLVKTFPTLALLASATRHIDGTFGGAFSEYGIRKEGVEAPDAEGGRRGDGRTEDVVISYDSQTADESWAEFVGRLRRVEGGWVGGGE